MDATQVPPPPPGPTAPGRPPLQRPRQGRILGGVAAGLAAHLGWDVVLVRLLIVVVTVLTQGLGVLAYLAAVLLMPSVDTATAGTSGQPAPAATARVGVPSEVAGRPPAFWFGVALLLFGLWWLFVATPLRFGLLTFGSPGAVAGPLLLIGVGLALWVTGDRAGTTTATPPTFAPTPASTVAPTSSSNPTPAFVPTPAPASAPALAPASTPQDPTMDTVTAPYRSETTPPPPTPPIPPTAGDGDGWNPPPLPDRTRSILGRATAGLALVTVGTLWILHLAGAITITFAQGLAAALLVVGLGLLVGTVLGRGRGLIWVGVILLPLVLVAQIPGPNWVGLATSGDGDGIAAGEVSVAPVSFDDLRSSYEVGAGSIRIDLTRLPFDGDRVDLEVSVGAGEIRVIVPDDVDVRATGRAGIGQVRVLDRSAGGLGVGDVEVELDIADAVGEVRLELQAGLGEIRVERAPARVGARG